MPLRDEINATALALKRARSVPEFQHGVELLRQACSGDAATFVSEIATRATGLLFASENPEQQAGIIALAVALGASADKVRNNAISARSLFDSHTQTQTVQLIEDSR